MSGFLAAGVERLLVRELCLRHSSRGPRTSNLLGHGHGSSEGNGCVVHRRGLLGIHWLMAAGVLKAVEGSERRHLIRLK